MTIHREKLDKIAATQQPMIEQSFEPQTPWTWSDDDFDDELPEIPEVKVKIEVQRMSPIEQVMVKQEMMSDDNDGSFSMPAIEVKLDPDENEKKKFHLPPSATFSAQSIEDDIKNEIIKKMLKCKLCDELFDDKESFEFHFSKAHKVKPKKESQSDTTCKICHKTFAKLQFLKLHVAAIHEKNLFECKICGKKFSFERAMIRHVGVIHNNERKYHCSHCDKIFGTSTQMKEHENYYHSTKPLDKKTHYCEFEFEF